MSLIAASATSIDRPSKLETGLGRLVLPVVVAFAAALYLWLGATLGLSGDEAGTLHTTGSGVGYALDQSTYFEYQSPTYFVMLAAWRTLDRGTAFARVPSTLFILATLPMIWHLLRSVRDARVRAIAVVTFAVFPFSIWSAVDARPYAMEVTSSALLLWATLFAYDAAELRVGRRAIWIVVAVLTVYVQYFAGAAVLGAIAIVATLRREHLRAMIVDSAIALVCCIPLFVIVFEQITAYSTSEPGRSGLKYAARVATSSLEYVVPHVGFEKLGKLASLGFAAAIAAVGWSAITASAPARRLVRALFAAVVVEVAFFVAIALLTHIQLFVPRHLIPIFPFVFVLTILSLGDLRQAVWAVSLYGAFVATTEPTILLDILPTDGGFTELASAIARDASAGSRVYVYPSENVMKIREAGDTISPALFTSVTIVALPRATNFEKYDHEGMLVFHPPELQKLSADARAGGSDFLVLNDPAVSDPTERRGIAEIEHAFSRDGRLERVFNGIADLYRVRPAARSLR